MSERKSPLLLQVGDSIPAAYLMDGSSGLVPTGAGSFFAIPAPALSAACEGLQTFSKHFATVGQHDV
jgi:hypothetical protein